MWSKLNSRKSTSKDIFATISCCVCGEKKRKKRIFSFFQNKTGGVIVIVHLGQYWRFYFPCFLGTRGGRSPTPSAQKAGRKTNNVARGAHIAYCTEGKTRVFHQSVMKSCQKTKNGKNWPNVHRFFSAKRQKKKCACFFFRICVYFPSWAGI